MGQLWSEGIIKKLKKLVGFFVFLKIAVLF